MTTIALVDDELNVLKSLKRCLGRQGWTLLDFTSPQEALQELDGKNIDLVLSDYRMPGMTGVEFLSEFKQLHPEAVRLVLSGQTDLSGLMNAINAAQIFRFILKPWNDDELVITLKQALEYNRLQRENRELADLVRTQKRELMAQMNELQRLEKESPGITQVNWSEDGSIDLSQEFED